MNDTVTTPIVEQNRGSDSVPRFVRGRAFLPGFPFQVWNHVGTHGEGILAHAKTRKDAEAYANIYRPLTCGYSKKKWHGRITIRKSNATVSESVAETDPQKGK